MTDLAEIKAGVAGLVVGQGEVLRRLDRIEKFVDEKAVTKPEHQALEQRVKRNEGVIGWAGRSIVGLFVAAVAAVVGMKGIARPLVFFGALAASIGGLA